MLKVLHTSDLHLGKKLFKIDRLAEQKYYLEWLVQICKNKEIDILLIAGDIFDTPSPPHEAVSLYFSFLSELSENTNTTALIIAGNHDSSVFIQAPEGILKKRNIYVWGELNDDPLKHHFYFSKDGQNYKFYLLPYFRSFDFLSWQQFYQNSKAPSDLEKREQEFLNTLKHFLEVDNQEEVNKIFIGHHLFGPFSAAGSEQVVSLSGMDTIPLNLFSNFKYLALGHIHKYQKVSNSIPAFYSGSPYPLRFSEKQVKKVNLIELDQMNTVITSIEIPQSRMLYSLNSSDHSLENDILNLIKNEDYLKERNLLSVEVKLENPTHGLADKVRDLLEGSNTDLIMLKSNYSEDISDKDNSQKFDELNLNELFLQFYQEKFNSSEVPPEILKQFSDLIINRDSL